MAGLVAMAVVVALAGVAGAPSAVAESPGTTAELRGLLDEGAALTVASSLNSEVEVSELTSEWRRVVATPEGKLRGEYTAGVARVRDGRGGWRDPDPTLRPGPDGLLHPVASRVPMGVSAGGAGALASIESGAQQLTMSWPDRLPVPSVDGDTATYAGVYPDVDLVVRAGADSLATYLVVKTPEASRHEGVRRVVFDVETTGVPQVRSDAAGGLSYRTSAGESAFGVSAATMWDAAGAEAGAESSDLIEPSAEAQVRTMGLSASASELVVVPDAAFLDDPATAYPVTIDPLVYAHGAGLSQRVTQTFTQTNYTGDAARVGYNGWTSPYYRSEMYYRFPMGELDTSAVESVEFRHDNVHSVQHSPCYDDSYGHPIEVGITNWVDEATKWSSRPEWLEWAEINDYAVGHENYCNGRATVMWDLTELFHEVHEGMEVDWDLVVGMRGEGTTDKYTWREFFNEFGAGSASRPLLTIEYAPRPEVAQAVMVAPSSLAAQNSTTVFTPTLTPTLQAVLPETQSCPAGLCQRVVFEVRNGAGALLWWGLSGVAGEGATVQATVGPNVLTTGVSYKVQVFVENIHYWKRSDALVMGKALRPWTTQPPAPGVSYPTVGSNPQLNPDGSLSVTMTSSSPLVSTFCWQQSAVGVWVAWDSVPANQCTPAVNQQALLKAGAFDFSANGRFTSVSVAAKHAPDGAWKERVEGPFTVLKP